MTLKDLLERLDELATILKSADGADGMVSRKDFRQLIATTDEAAQRHLLELFYAFIIRKENRSGVRVTHDLIDEGIDYIKTVILPEFEIAEVFSNKAEQAIAQIHESSLPLANQLIRAVEEENYLDASEVATEIGRYAEGLFFDDFGSEGSENVEAFFQAAEIDLLTPEAFAEALNLDENNPKEKIERFEDIGDTLDVFVEQHVRFGRDEQAGAIAELLEEYLTDLKVVILGEDYNPAVPPEHPTYIVGIDQDGSIAGFQTKVIWT